MVEDDGNGDEKDVYEEKVTNHGRDSFPWWRLATVTKRSATAICYNYRHNCMVER